VESAREAGLRYVTDAMPGVRRVKRGRAFSYVDAEGRPITDPAERRRFDSLAIPPAWTDVWICPHPRGHLQATGRDAKGRKQYRYHAKYRQVRDEAKFERLLDFGEALPAIRRRVEEDLARPGLPREKVLAAMISLLETTHMRVGNDEYARANDSYGLTTLRNDHAEIAGASLTFAFRAKGGKDQVITLRDRRLARIVKQARDIPGERLFQYRGDDGQFHAIYSEDVNAYLREITGQEFSAKDFRTWAGTVAAANVLRELPPFQSKTEAKHNVVQAIEAVARHLGNTRAVAKKSYVHPAIVEAYLEGTLADEARGDGASGELPPDEAAVLAVLRARAARAGHHPALAHGLRKPAP
jgi:DNA topoisomerase I